MSGYLPPSRREEQRFELGMLRQAADERRKAGVVNERADARLAEVEATSGHLLPKGKATDAAMDAYFAADARRAYRGRRARARQATRFQDATPRQRRYARRLLAECGISARGLSRLSKHEVGLIIGRLR